MIRDLKEDVIDTITTPRELAEIAKTVDLYIGQLDEPNDSTSLMEKIDAAMEIFERAQLQLPKERILTYIKYKNINYEHLQSHFSEKLYDEKKPYWDKEGRRLDQLAREMKRFGPPKKKVSWIF